VDEVENMKLLEELHKYEPQGVYNSDETWYFE
jgi:hypothetical protein